MENPFAFVRRLFFGLHCIFLGVRRRHSSVFPPTDDLHRRKIRRCESSSPQSHLSTPEKTLNDLLEEYEDVLLRVLSCLVDDGLHECRRVCRHWREICKELPVTLGERCIYRPKMMAELFPGAGSLTLERAFDDKDVRGRGAIERLSRLGNLQCLNLSAYSERPDINSLAAALPSAHCLRSLKVSVSERDTLDDLVRALRLLTNLDALTLHVSRFIQTDLEPVTELGGLKHLRTDLSVIVNSHRQLLFPSLTRLTQLHLRSVHEREPETSFSLQTMLPYAQTLQTLELFHSYRNLGLWSATEHEWRAFSRLLSLSVSRHSYRPRDAFFRALREMNHLTKLSFAASDHDQSVLAECLSLLTGLRSLNISGGRQWTIILPELMERHLMALTQLTELSLEHCRIGRYQRFPTGIQSFTCSFSGSPPESFPEIMMSMTNLKSLSVLAPSSIERLFRPQGVPPSQFSQELRRLKHLSTLNVLVDDLFLEALATLTQLTSLKMANTVIVVDLYHLLPSLSNLLELVELEISSPATTPVRSDGFSQLCLPKLREFDLPLIGTDDEMRRALWKSLPCLRNMRFSGRSYYL